MMAWTRHRRANQPAQTAAVDPAANPRLMVAPLESLFCRKSPTRDVVKLDSVLRRFQWNKPLAKIRIQRRGERTREPEDHEMGRHPPLHGSRKRASFIDIVSLG